jgi:hypothetical protein
LRATAISKAGSSNLATIDQEEEADLVARVGDVALQPGVAAVLVAQDKEAHILGDQRTG